LEGKPLSYLARCIFVAVAAGAFFLGQPGTSAAQENTTSGQQPESHYKCDTQGVQLEGLLTTRTFYGPPGFGETPAKDAREKTLILKLAKPITVDPIDNVKANKGSCWGDFPHLRAVQLFISPQDKAADARKLVGKQVVAVGTLREGDAPSEHTKVIMEVKTVDPK
jgi:hypothetical protein